MKSKPTKNEVLPPPVQVLRSHCNVLLLGTTPTVRSRPLLCFLYYAYHVLLIPVDGNSWRLVWAHFEGRLWGCILAILAIF